jgi:pimeloyl-ACP methyl ester carboxylesterase
MAVLSELRYPTTFLTKLISSLLALALLIFVALAAMAGVLLYQILRPTKNTNSFDLNVMMGHPSAVDFTLDNGQSREGWFFPGFRGAPTIVLCHGYLSQRSDILTLSSALQDQQYNVFLFDFSGHGSSPGITALGYREVGELRAAVQALAGRNDVDPAHFGIWGSDMGAYAAIELAASDHRLAAIVADSVYNDPSDLVRIEVNRSGLAALPLVTRFSEYGFRLIEYPFRQEPRLATRVGRLQGIPKLFIENDSRLYLAESTVQLYLISPEPKEQWRAKLRYSEMGDDDRHVYENLIVTFFLKSLPLTASSPASH